MKLHWECSCFRIIEYCLEVSIIPKSGFLFLVYTEKHVLVEERHIPGAYDDSTYADGRPPVGIGTPPPRSDNYVNGRSPSIDMVLSASGG